MREDLRETAAVFRHRLRAVLAEADAVAVAARRDGDCVVRHGKVHRCRAQAERAAQRRPFDSGAAEKDRADAAALRPLDAAEPVDRGTGEIGVRGYLRDARGKFRRAERDLVRIARRVLLAGTVHALQIGNIAAPDGERGLRFPAGAAEEGRVDQRTAIGEDQPVRAANRLLDELDFRRSPVRRPPLTAGGIRADVRADVLSALGLAQREGARGDRLRLERFRRELRGHLRQQHPDEIVFQRHLPHAAVRQHAQRDCRVKGRVRLWRLRRGRGDCRLCLPLREEKKRRAAKQNQRKRDDNQAFHRNLLRFTKKT